MRLSTFALGLLFVVSGVVLAPIVVDRVQFFLLTGRLIPVSHVEHLNSPVRVKKWDERGLLVADGRIVMPRGVVRLPKASKALTELTSRGVEVDQTGTVYGLVKVLHWCGNDPVKNDIRRVDIGQVLAFVGEGKTTIKASSTLPVHLYNQGGTFTQYGWNVSEFSQYKRTFPHP